MKDKGIAAALAILLGWMGAHRFYLGQIGRGIGCIIFMPISLFIAPLIGLIWLIGSDESFDDKYNKQIIQRKQLRVQQEMLEALTSKNNK